MPSDLLGAIQQVTVFDIAFLALFSALVLIWAHEFVDFMREVNR